jgi:hypothetical protein
MDGFLRRVPAALLHLQRTNEKRTSINRSVWLSAIFLFSLSETDPRAAAVLVGELDAGRFQRLLQHSYVAGLIPPLKDRSMVESKSNSETPERSMCD